MPHVTFIHGIANKPPADELLEIWRRALANDGGIDLGTKGVSSSMVYWADVLYAEPAADAEAHESVGLEAVTGEDDEDDEWRETLAGDEKAFVDALAEKLNFDVPSPEDEAFEAPPTDEGGFEAIPLPWFIKRRLMKVLLRDVHHYLFNAEHSPRPGETYRVRDEIRDRFVGALKRDSAATAGRGTHVLLSHSMGTVISYDCLKRVPDCPQVDALITVGSPLGIDEVQEKLRPGWTRYDGYPGLKVASGWANVFDRLDPVAFDTSLADDFQRGGTEVVIDRRQRNRGRWRHGITGYLAEDELRTLLAQQLGVGWP